MLLASELIHRYSSVVSEMSKKLELKVQVFCEKCKITIMTAAAKLDGVKSLSLDADKGVLTITGTVDAVEVVKQLRKAKMTAEIISLGPEKKEEKKDEKKGEKKDKKKGEKKEEKKSCESKPQCYCHYPRQSGFPQIVFYEQYPDNNCTIA